MPYLASNREHLSVVAFGGRAPEGHERRSILICDSELESVRVLKTVLRGAGLTAFSVPTAEDALKRVTLRVPDAVIVETDLLDSDGLEVSRRLREWSSMPLIVVSRVSDEDRVIQAFRSGADDYITKPFRPGELVVRVQAHLRRAQVGESEPVLQWDGLSVDLAARVVRRNGAETRLTPTEFKLLSALARNRGRVVTHEELLREVWGGRLCRRPAGPTRPYGELAPKTGIAEFTERDPHLPRRWLFARGSRSSARAHSRPRDPRRSPPSSYSGAAQRPHRSAT